MTKFESIACEYQRDARSKTEAHTRFLDSCRICSRKGLRIDCERCAVPVTHDMVVAAFEASEIDVRAFVKK